MLTTYLPAYLTSDRSAGRGHGALKGLENKRTERVQKHQRISTDPSASSPPSVQPNLEIEPRKMPLGEGRAMQEYNPKPKFSGQLLRER